MSYKLISLSSFVDNNLHDIWRVSCLFGTSWWLLAEKLRPIKSLNNDFNCKFHPSKAPPLLFGQNFLTLVGRICKWCILDTTIAWKAKNVCIYFCTHFVFFLAAQKWFPNCRYVSKWKRWKPSTLTLTPHCCPQDHQYL